jgi:hypothetical protein
MNPVAITPAPGLADRYAHGVGPAPHSWEMPRSVSPRTNTCGTCGLPWKRGHECPASETARKVT